MPNKRANYTDEEKAYALAYYHECRSAKKTVRDLGYPLSACLYNWIAEEGHPKKPRKKKSINKRFSTFEERLQVVHRCVDLGEDVHLIAKEYNRNTSTVYEWCRIYKKEGHISLMKKKKQNNLLGLSNINRIGVVLFFAKQKIHSPFFNIIPFTVSYLYTRNFCGR